MIITNTFDAFLKAKNESGRSWSEIAGFCNMTVPNTIQAVKRKQFNYKYVLAAQALGYDIEVRFVPHNGQFNDES